MKKTNLEGSYQLDEKLSFHMTHHFCLLFTFATFQGLSCTEISGIFGHWIRPLFFLFSRFLVFCLYSSLSFSLFFFFLCLYSTLSFSLFFSYFISSLSFLLSLCGVFLSHFFLFQSSLPQLKMLAYTAYWTLIPSGLKGLRWYCNHCPWGWLVKEQL